MLQLLVAWIRAHTVLSSFFAGLAFYAVSAVGHTYPIVAAAATIVAGLGGLALAWYRPRWAAPVLALELVIGSFGHLTSVFVLGFDLPLRQALFIGVILGWIFGQLETRQSIFWLPKPFSGPLRLFWIAVIVSVLFSPDSANVVHDFNGYLYLLAAPLIFSAVRAGDWALYGRILAGGVIALATVTMATLLGFGWIPRENLNGLYTWIRDVRLGEITPVAGTYYRVFMQSQLYALLLAVGGAAAALWSSSPWSRRAALTAAWVGTVVVVASLSRSFWVAGIIGLVTLTLLLRRNGVKYTNLVRYVVITIAVVVVTFYGLQLATGNFPLSLQQRLDINEPAAAARSAQAGPLWSAVWRHPLWGSGFGTTVTYRAVDPRRLVQSTVVTTDTFELGWLDTWLDIGLVGIFALLWWLHRLWRLGRAVAQQSAVGVITMLAVVALIVVHLFTPYLNHPLGLGLLLFLSALQPRTSAADHA